MLLSMTGYSRKEYQHENKVITIECKTLNSRNIEISLKIPYCLKDIEITLRKWIADKLQRGKVDFYVHIQFLKESPLQLNEMMLRTIFFQLKPISDDLQQDSSHLLSSILHFPELIQYNPNVFSEEEKKIFIQQTLSVLDDVTAFRKREGEYLSKDILSSLTQIETQLQRLSSYEQERTERIQRKLMEALQTLSYDYNKERLEQELLYYLEKFDINEEKVRLKTHLDYFRKLLQSPQSEGKKLSFLTQEIGREINTIGSKANHETIQHIVVEMKELLEKIREQLCNVI